MSKVRVLQVSGSPYELGYTHGKAFAKEIGELTEERLHLSCDPFWTGGQQASLDEVLALGQACLRYHEEFDPALMEEMRGMADATGIGVNELVIMNGFTDFVDVVANPNRAMTVCESRQFTRSVDDEQFRSDTCRGPMWLAVVRDLVAHARRQHECPAIFELGVQLSLETQKDMSLRAPMVRNVARRVLEPCARECRRTVRCASRRGPKCLPIGRRARMTNRSYRTEYQSCTRHESPAVRLNARQRLV